MFSAEKLGTLYPCRVARIRWRPTNKLLIPSSATLWQGVDEDSRQGQGYFTRRSNRILPEFKGGGGEKGAGGGGRSLRSRMSLSTRGRQEDGPDDLEMQDKLDR